MRATDRLDAYLAAERRMPLEWGRRNGDCILLIAGWHEILTGVRHGDEWRGRYCDEAGATRVIEESGGLPVILTGYFGAPRMGSPARRGDVGLIETTLGWTGVICTGRYWAGRTKDRGIMLARIDPEFVWDMRF